jgi:hypothetical protein
LDNIIDYEKAKERFAIWIKSTVSAEHADDMRYHLEKYLTEPISNQSDLLLLISTYSAPACSKSDAIILKVLILLSFACALKSSS